MSVSYQDINISLVEENISAQITEETISAAIVEEVIAVDITEEIIQLNITEAEEIYSTVAAEEIIVEVESWSCPKVVTGSGSGFIFITDVTTSGIAGNKVYQEDTVPADTVLQSVTIDEANCTVYFIAEGGEEYSPSISIDDTVCTNLIQTSQDKRLFTGSISITVSEATTVTVTSSTGQTASVEINRAAAPPEILSCIIGDYPGTQTAAKQGDIIHVTGTVEEDATHVRLANFEAFQSSSWIPCSGGIFDITGTVSNASGLQGAQVYAKNALGSEGVTFNSSNDIFLDQISPSFTDLGVTYPIGQAALKETETAIQNTIVSNYTAVSYSSPHGDISIENINSYEQEKTVTCLNPGDYNDSSINFRIVASKSTNGTSAVFSKIIEVADIAPVITVSFSGSRLRSAPSGQNHTVTASSNQNLLDAPGINIPISGVWQGSAFVGGPKVFIRTITIFDDSIRGSGAWTLNTIPTNRAGISASITGTQVVGGFVSRDLTLPAFGTSLNLTTFVTNSSKLNFTWSFKSNMVFQSIGTTPPVVSGYTIDSIGINPTEIIILDTQAASASSQESTITIEEVA